MRKIMVIEVASEYGAGTRGASLGPEAVRWAALNNNYRYYREYPRYIYRPDEGPDPMFRRAKFPNARRIHELQTVFEEVALVVSDTINAGVFPIIITGDHSNAIGGFSGVSAAYPGKRMGLVWIDAHADLHTPFSTPSGNMHGMPVAAALAFDNKSFGSNAPGDGVEAMWNTICNIGGQSPKVMPRDLVYVGVRSTEKEEDKLIEQFRIRKYEIAQVDEMGTVNLAHQILSYLKDCDIIYVSFDIDSLDSRIVPGTGTPVDDGLSYTQAATLLKLLWKSEKLAALEFTEVNPLLDHKNQTAEVAAWLLEELLDE
ncbi:MAG: arginase [Bacteroidia bacterium]|nr:arginase [Bacteroidia bacterium]